MLNYVKSLISPTRRKTREVRVGDVVIGGDHSIVIQSMTTTLTTDTKATVDQIERLAKVGCPIVRVTVPGLADVENLPNIRAEMKKRGIRVPLVADVHFLPEIALKACDYMEKVRINPGNFADRKRFVAREYTDAEYAAELNRIGEAFLPILRRAKKNGVALRIGTNHGSLSDRIMNRFGDTPLGMVESALEFVRIAEGEGFRQIVISMKASNPLVMIQAYRLLVARMDEAHMDYPLHLGVTEAGEGEDGRIKSAMGIGALLADGLGDTIRVSLTEDPEFEIPVAERLIRHYSRGSGASREEKEIQPAWDFFSYERRASEKLVGRTHAVGGKEMVRVRTEAAELEPKADAIVIEKSFPRFKTGLSVVLRPSSVSPADLSSKEFDEISLRPSPAWRETGYLEKFSSFLNGRPLWLRIARASEIETVIDLLKRFEGAVKTGIELEGRELIALGRRVASRFSEARLSPPIHLHFIAGSSETEEDLLIRASVELGSLLCDGIGDSIEVSSSFGPAFNGRLSFNILQAARLRMSKAEYIACPSCGRTLFDLQAATARIREKTNHLKGVKIAVMGCIVNGPGEMADADFGYVGSGPGHINLYVGKECVERQIPEAEADRRLIELIKGHGRWVDPPA